MKRIYMFLLASILCINILGCSHTETKDNINLASTPAMSENTSEYVDNKNQETSEPENTKNINTPLPEETEPAATPETGPVTGKISASQQYSDINRVINVLGLKEYKKIKSDKYTDKASNGKKFLILFLSISNTSHEDDYINYNYISAKIDGKEIEHTAIFNEPRNYPTIFNTIKAGKTSAGFIAWEIPENWTKFEFTYNGWENIDNLSIEAEFTPKDLSNPVIYNASNYN